VRHPRPVRGGRRWRAQQIRQALGVDAPTSVSFGDQLNACFEAELLPMMGERRYMVWWIINPDTVGGLLTLRRSTAVVLQLGL